MTRHPYCTICRRRHGDWDGNPETEPFCLSVLAEAEAEEADYWERLEAEPTL